jgi:hypothetical protein
MQGRKRPTVAQEPCIYYWEGKCSRGIWCSYAHHNGELDTKHINYHAVRAECCAWTLGHCRDDRYCPWAHTTAEQIKDYALKLAKLEEDHRRKAAPLDQMPSAVFLRLLRNTAT